MFKRDLSAELRQEQETVAEHSAKAQKLMPPVPKGPPPQQANIESVRTAATLAQHFELDAVICIRAEDSLCNGYIAAKDEASCADITALGGNYFDTGVKLHGARVWKSAHFDEGESPYYMFANVDKHQGQDFVSWYVADQIWSNEKEMNLCNKNPKPPHIVAWGKGTHFMTECHFPYWQKKVCREVAIVSLWDQALKTSEQLEQLIAEYGSPTTELQLAEPEEAIEAGHVDTGKGKQDAKGKGYGGKGKQKPDATHRGGWLPKMAKLVVAVLDQNFGRAADLANWYCETSQTLANIVDKRNGSSSSSDGGWNW